MRAFAIFFAFGLTVLPALATGSAPPAAEAARGTNPTIVPDDVCRPVVLPTGEAPSVSAARSALGNGHIQLAAAHLKPLADTVPEAAELYGDLLIKGARCVPPDKGNGVAYLRHAIQGKDMHAAAVLAQYYYEGTFLGQNDDEAFRLFTMAAESGDMVSAVNLALMYNAGRGTNRDTHQYLVWMVRAAEAGRPMALTNIAAAYHYGEVLPKDDKVAFFWLCTALYRSGNLSPANRQHILWLRNEIALAISPNDVQKIADRAKAWVPGAGALADVLNAERAEAAHNAAKTAGSGRND